MTPSIDMQAVAISLGFTLEQLEANRAGRVTSDQLMALASDLVIAVLLVVAVIGLALASRKLGGGWTLKQWIIIAVVGLVGLGIAGLMGLAPLRDLLSGAPAVAEGMLDEIRSETRGKGQAPVLIIGDVEIAARGEPKLVREQVPLGKYRAYYLPHTRRLLSLEPAE